MARSRDVVVRPLDLEVISEHFWREDGVHLNIIGFDLWCLAL